MGFSHTQRRCFAVDIKYLPMKMITLFFIAFTATLICGAPQEDEIIDLPGLNFPINFRHYSGYLRGANKIQLHYWFVESERNPSSDPLLLWLNGGPGCSSMEGLLKELGPYLIADDGRTLVPNNYAWNTIANVLFLEAPACVGFSFDADGNCETGDDEVSLSNYLALQDFFRKFPEFKNNSFYVTGESYSGIYVPTLVVRILQNQNNYFINIKGYAIGNGLSSYAINDNSLVFFGYYHGLYGDDLWAKLVDHCCTGNSPSKSTCNFSSNKWPLCSDAVQKAMDIIYNEGLNVYNLYGDSGDSLQSHRLCRKKADVSNLFRSYMMQNVLLQSTPCSGIAGDSGLTLYLNTKEVWRSIHVSSLPTGNWSVCSDAVIESYHREYQDMRQQYAILTTSLPGLIYNGDIDMACNFLGDEWFTESLNLKVTEKRRMWHQKGEVAGFVKRFENLDVVTIRGAGHMVPQDKPAYALKMIQSFLYNIPY